jgi:hypothetical protein
LNWVQNRQWLVTTNSSHGCAREVVGQLHYIAILEKIQKSTSKLRGFQKVTRKTIP